MWKKRLKSLLGQCLFRTGVYRLFYRDKALVVLFHRVDDRLDGDPISCTERQFTEYCRFFKRYFNVVSFSELLDRLESGQDIGRMLAITFDDGYRDNYETAAPILRDFGLPACFFIATDFIGTEHVPWWDRELPVRPRWMDWRQVRQLRADGFEIGAHTCSHPDLATLNAADARREIAESRIRLETVLQAPVPLFSYPYGGRRQITDDERELVRALGFRCCPSAFGGAVAAGDDPFHLRRQPISPWFISPWQFGLECLAAASAQDNLRGQEAASP